MIKIVKYVIVDLLRNRIMLFYTALLLVISLSVFNLEDNADKSLVSLLNIILIIVPLISIVFSTIYTYNSSEFIELLVSQPLKRSAIWLSVFLGLAVTLSLAGASIVASVLGLVLPWLLLRGGFDPAYGSGPLATIVQDVLSLLIYFSCVSAIVM